MYLALCVCGMCCIYIDEKRVCDVVIIRRDNIILCIGQQHGAYLLCFKDKGGQPLAAEGCLHHGWVWHPQLIPLFAVLATSWGLELQWGSPAGQCACLPAAAAGQAGTEVVMAAVTTGGSSDDGWQQPYHRQ